MERTIRVTGKGNLSVKPDTVRLIMTMVGMEKEYDAALEEYKYVHRMKIEFPADNRQLGRILYKLGHSPVKPEFRIEYTVSEPEKCKNELLANAVTDAKAKAEVLSKAAGVELGEIFTIDYSWGEIEFVSRPLDNLILDECCMKRCEADEAYDIDINPDDIDVTDHVTVLWGIK